MIERIIYIVPRTRQSAALQQAAAVVARLGLEAAVSAQQITLMTDQLTPHAIAAELQQAGLSAADYHLRVEYRRRWGYL